MEKIFNSCECTSNNSMWTFLFGAISYAAVEANAVKYVIEILKPILPPQMYFTMIAIITIISMIHNVVTFHIKQNVKVFSQTVKDIYAYSVKLMYPPTTHDIPQATMKRPTPRKDLTSEFIAASKIYETDEIKIE